jgi:hypothetical protein
MKKISKELAKSKNKVKAIWKHHKVEKRKIESKKTLPLDFKRGLIKELTEVTKSNISNVWEDYRGFKFGVFHDSPYSDFSYVKRHNTINTQQDFYKAKRFYNEGNLDSQIGNILSEPGVLGVGLIFKVQDEETDLIMHVSDYITKGLYERLQQKGISLFNHLSTKLKYSKSVHEYELKDIYIRIIYEKSKKNNGTNGKKEN